MVSATFESAKSLSGVQIPMENTGSATSVGEMFDDVVHHWVEWDSTGLWIDNGRDLLQRQN
jgi:hypothetical protein